MIGWTLLRSPIMATLHGFNMMKSFHFDGPTWAFLSPDQMYDEEGKLRRAHKHYQNADIYFLTIMKKCLFRPTKTKVSLNGNIKCEICIGDPIKKKFDHVKISFPIAEFLYAMPGIKDRFENSNEFLFFTLFNQYLPKTNIKKWFYEVSKNLLKKRRISPDACFKVLRAIYSLDIRVSHSTRFEIDIYDPLKACIINNEKAEAARKYDPKFYELNEKDWDLSRTKDVDYNNLPGYEDLGDSRLTVDQIISLFSIDVGNQRIAYIGKTEQEPFDRLFPHKKLNELDAKLLRNEYETLIIHLFGFMNWDSPISSLPANTSIPKSDAITIAEAELINYFKPSENDIYVKDEGRANWNHIRLLVNKEYKKILGLLDIDGQYTKFYTSHIGDTKLNKHEIQVDLSKYRCVQRENSVDS